MKIKIVRTRIPKRCTCPVCGVKQRFRLNHQRYRYIKDLNLNQPLMLKIHTVYAKCLNPACSRRTFSLPIKDVTKYKRATNRLIQESISGIIDDNSTTPRISKRLNRSFNTTGSKSSIDRWKHDLANRLDIKKIIAALKFSGILCIDEYKPKRATGYDLIDSDGITGNILYLEKAYGLGRGIVRKHFERVSALGVKPWCVIFDMRSCFPSAAKKVFGNNILIQFDYFHVMKIIHYHLNRAMAEYRHILKDMGFNTLDIWEAKWTILKNIESWSPKEHQIMAFLLRRYKSTVIEDIIILKQRVRDIFIKSNDQEDAFKKRDTLTKESFKSLNVHFANIIQFLNSSNFRYMTTFLDHPEIPRSGNSENLIRTWRQMEKVRYGFKTDKGRLNHLKLYQVSRYLRQDTQNKFFEANSFNNNKL